MFTQKECILTQVLNCSFEELRLLEDINYSLTWIVSELIENECLSFNNIFYQVFQKGASDLKNVFDRNKDCIKQKILDEICKQIKCRPDNETSAYEILSRIERLIDDYTLIEDLDAVDQCDIDIGNHGLYVYMDHIEFYREWLKEEVETIERNMGHHFI